MELRKEGGKRFLLSILIGAFCLGLFWVGIFAYLRWSKERWEKDERVRILEVLNFQRSLLENELYARIYYTRSVAAYVSLNPDIDKDEFQNLAAELIGVDEVINSMALSPNGVLSFVYPKEGHEEAIGLDLFAHPERREIVEQTIRSRKTFVAGPVELVEGGIAFISYTPIFDKTTPEPWEFWGVADIVILEEGLFEAAVLETEKEGVKMALQGTDGRGKDGEVFFGDPEVFENQPVEIVIRLPDGEWILGGHPVGGWSGYLDQDRTMLLLMVGGSAVIAVLIGFLVSAVLKLKASRHQLHELNEDKSRLISVIAHDLRSPISAVSSLSNELLEPGELQVESEQKEIVELIHQCADEGLLLLENLLNWVRSREAGGMIRAEDVDLASLCDQVLELFRVAIRGKSLEVVMDIPPGTMVSIDSRVLETVLRNLISNAIKYSEFGGTIRIGMKELDEGRLEVFVEDHGRGMSPEKVEQVLSGVYHRSAHGTGSEKGAGIGLNLCLELLRYCGQKVRIESREGAGTMVSFSLLSTRREEREKENPGYG